VSVNSKKEKKMRKFMMIFLLVGLVGCAYEGEKVRTYFDEPQLFIRDPHFRNYKQAIDDLESQYLKKDISYAEYVEQKEKLDTKYSREVQERNQKIEE